MVAKHYVGIDPGLNGGIAVIDDQANILYSFRMPVSKANEKALEYAEILAFFKTEVAGLENPFISLEKVAPFPTGSRLAAFTFGGVFWTLYALCELSGLRWSLVTPKQWQKTTLHGIPLDLKPKKRALMGAKQLFPKLHTTHDGIIDALLIAEYARRTM